MIKNTILLFITFLFFSCSYKERKTIVMTSFHIVDQRDFEMCFSEQTKGNYSIKIITKSGKEIKKGGPLIFGGVNILNSCIRTDKMQYSFRAYNVDETTFYKDSVINDNIREVKWELYKQDYQSPFASGIYKLSNL